MVSWQLGRPARPFRRVAVRCPYGFPAVTEQAPFGPDGEPFPTTYYLTCPWLVAALARLEAAGGVERWSRAAAEDPVCGASLARADREQRELRPELDVGIGGTRARRATSSACTPTRPSRSRDRATSSGSAILAEVGERWCPDARCARALDGAAAAVMLDSAR